MKLPDHPDALPCEQPPIGGDPGEVDFEDGAGARRRVGGHAHRFHDINTAERNWCAAAPIGVIARLAQARLGRASRNGVAFSNASATRNTVGSANGLPTSWIATGRSPAPNPAHTVIAG